MNLVTRAWRESASSVVFALALTAVLAATLFVVVALNPKQAVYGNLPWYYAGFCALVAPLLFLLCKRLDAPGRARGVTCPDCSRAAGR